jgi:hypothetical protein
MATTTSSPSRLHLCVVSVDRLLEKDSSPLLNPVLHPEAAESLLRQADEFPPRHGYQLALQVPAADRDRLTEVRAGLRNWALDQAQCLTQELRAKLRKGSRALILALVVVAALFVLIEWLQAFGQGHLYRLFGESLIIIAWVSLWVPVETLLVEPVLLRQRRRLFQALARADINLDIRSE